MKPIYNILDFEASALNNGYPIEAGLAFLWGNGDITSDSRLIRHDPWLNTKLWSEEAQSIHKITKDELREKGRTVEHVAQWLNTRVGRADLYVSHFKDYIWLSQLFDEAGHVPQCRLRYADSILGNEYADDERGHIIYRSIKHRAEADAIQLAGKISEKVLNSPALHAAA